MLQLRRMAQVVPAIKGGGIKSNVYGLYVPVKTDFIPRWYYPPTAPSHYNTFDANGWNQGFSAGADFPPGTVCVWPTAVERALPYSTGTYGQATHFFMFGPELHYIYKRFRPYGNFMIGPGTLRTERARRQSIV